MGKIRIIAALLLVAGMAIGYFVYSTEEVDESRFAFKLGLDLAGGTLLTYEADTSGISDSEIGSSMESLRNVIERRVNLFGVSEPVVQIEKASIFSGTEENVKQRLIVELPGVTDIDEAVKQIGKTPLLEFKLRRGGTEDDGSPIYDDTGLTGALVKRANLQFGQGQQGGLSNEPTVLLEFNSDGRKLFAEVTRVNVGNILAIFLDGVSISEPVIQTEISDGNAVISGNFTPDEARELVRDLNFGALPLPISLIGTQTIGASLGSDILGAGLRAGIIGLSLVALFLLIWYRLPGLVAVVALFIYVAAMLAIFKLVPVTITAAGITGFILSIGMAVDANILIFERIKEEIEYEKDLRVAVRNGFKRAWNSIRDGNLSSILTAVILFWLGTSLVEGFALTFGFGVLVSMITAITVTRSLLIAISPEKTSWVFGHGFKNPTARDE